MQNSDIEKCILMAASGEEFISETFCMAASQKQLQTYIRFRNSYHILHFLLWRHVKEDRIFMIFLSKGFGEECKHTELALNFVQKQNFS